MTNIKPVETFFSSKSTIFNTPFSQISLHRRAFGNCPSKRNVASYKNVDEDKDSTLKIQNNHRTIDVYR